MASLSLPTPVDDIICLAVCSVSALSDHPVVDTPVGALDATLETSKEHRGGLESQDGSKDAEIIAKVAQVDSLDRRFQIVEEGALHMSGTIREHCPQKRPDEAVNSCAEFASRSAESRLQVVCAFESSIWANKGQLHTNKTRIEK